ncbi:MAG: hypothetical protein R3Y45_05150 [Bacillota bacterium]
MTAVGDKDATHYWNGSDVVDTDPNPDNNNDYKFKGGAITGGATSKITNNTNVGLVYGGGGIFVLSSGKVNMYAGTIIGNKTKTTNSYGGGVYVWNGGVFNMYGGEISYNSSASIGGGVYSDGEFNLIGGKIKNNTATYGAGIYADGEVSNDDAKVTISGGTISANTATYGAGIYVAGTVVMNGGSVTGNKADTGTGGGAYLKDGSFTVSDDAKISGNTAVRTTGTTTNNVNIPNNSMTITVAGALTGTIGVIRQSGTGTVATYSGTYSELGLTNITSDDTSYYRLINEDGTVELILSQIIDGKNDSIVYYKDAITINAVTDSDGTTTESSPFFAKTDLTGAATYTVTPTTGAGTYDKSTGKLTVTSVGEFKIEVSVENTENDPPKYGTATLTVTQATITLDSISAIASAYDSNNRYVELDQSVYVEVTNEDGYQITGVINNDDVALDFSDSYGYITSTSYSTDDFTGSKGYDITVHGLTLTGADSGNYMLIINLDDDNPPTVTINTAIPYIAWPAATDITYGETTANSILSGGKVVVKLADGNDQYVDITQYGDFEWTTEISGKNVGSYAHAVQFDFDGKDGDDTSTVGDWVWNATDGDSDNTNGNWVLKDTDGNVVYTISGAVITALESQIHYVSYDVQAAAVSFEVSGNAVVTDGTFSPTYTTTCEVGSIALATDTSAGYKILYYYIDDNGIQYDDYSEIETGGTIQYYIGAEFVNADGSTNYNYHHSGSADSTAKQIAVLNIFDETDLTEYSTTFVYTASADATDDTTANTAATSISAYAGDIVVLPTLTTDANNDVADYIGWKYDGTIYDFGSRFTQPDSDVEFTAVAAETAYEISGSISGIDLDTTKGALSGVSIFLMQGSELIASDVTNADGTYSISAPDGRYTLVAMRDLGSIVNQESIFIEVSNVDNSDDYAVSQDIELPNIRQSISLNVDAGFTGITASGLYGFIGAEEENTINVNVDQVDLYGTEYSAILAAAAEDDLTTDNVKLFYDINATEQPTFETTDDNTNDVATIDDGDTIPLKDFDSGFTFYIPIAGMYQDKDYYYVYKSDASGIVEILTQSNSIIKDDEYFSILDNDTLVIHTTEPVVFALAFENDTYTMEGAELTSKVYSSDSISLENLGIFTSGSTYTDKTGTVENILLNTSDYDCSYIVTPISGAGVFDEENNTLKVTKVGTFEISVVIPASETTNAREWIITSTLTVDPKPVYISGIETIDRSYIDGYYYAQIESGIGTITGIINEDTVYVDTSSASGTITDAADVDSEQDDYDAILTATDRTFNVSVSGVKLTGDDAGNYTIQSVADSTVYIDVNDTYFSWPTATSITYGQTLNDSTLYGGKVYVVEKDATQVETITLIDGDFVWDNTALSVVNDAGTYNAAVSFVVNDENTDTFETEITLDEATTFKTDVTFVSGTLTDTLTDTNYVKGDTIQAGTEITSGTTVLANISYQEKYAYVESTTQYISYVINVTPVVFSVSDDTQVASSYGSALYPTVVGTYTEIITDTDGTTISEERTLPLSDYNVIYFQSTDAGYVTIENPTEVGTYLVGCEFTSTNYHHSGTSESTAKQIGSFYITESNETVTTYNVNFYVNNVKNDDLSTTVKYQDVLILPTIAGDDYIGWANSDGTFYEFGARLPYTFESDTTLNAVAAPETYAISGTIKGTELGQSTDSGIAGLSHIAITIMQGSEIIATTETKSDDESTADINEVGT